MLNSLLRQDETFVMIIPNRLVFMKLPDIADRKHRTSDYVQIPENIL